MTISRTENGVYSIAPTPFTDDGSVDYASIDRMVDFYTEAGVTGLTVLGVLGEAPKLTQEESVAIASRIIDRANFPVIVGVSSPGFAAMKSLSDQVMSAGAAGVMIAPLPTLRTDDQIAGYYAGAARGSGHRHPIRHPGLSADLLGADECLRHCAHR